MLFWLFVSTWTFFLWLPFWLVGAPPILVYFGGDWDVHWRGGNRDFDPWPNGESFKRHGFSGSMLFFCRSVVTSEQSQTAEVDVACGYDLRTICPLLVLKGVDFTTGRMGSLF